MRVFRSAACVTALTFALTFPMPANATFCFDTVIVAPTQFPGFGNVYGVFGTYSSADTYSFNANLEAMVPVTGDYSSARFWAHYTPGAPTLTIVMAMNNPTFDTYTLAGWFNRGRHC